MLLPEPGVLDIPEEMRDVRCLLHMLITILIESLRLREGRSIDVPILLRGIGPITKITRHQGIGGEGGG